MNLLVCRYASLLCRFFFHGVASMERRVLGGGRPALRERRGRGEARNGDRGALRNEEAEEGASSHFFSEAW